MAKKQKKTESDSTYVMKLVLYFLLGSLWLFIEKESSTIGLPLPIGFIIGLIFVSHDHFAIDKKIEYAVLVVSMFVSYFLPLGLVVSL